jgi:hypothetical protein
LLTKYSVALNSFLEKSDSLHIKIKMVKIKLYDRKFLFMIFNSDTYNGNLYYIHPDHKSQQSRCSG